MEQTYTELITKAALVNCRPLSPVILTGTPNRENISFNIFIVYIESMVLVIFTSL